MELKIEPIIVKLPRERWQKGDKALHEFELVEIQKIDGDLNISEIKTDYFIMGGSDFYHSIFYPSQEALDVSALYRQAYNHLRDLPNSRVFNWPHIKKIFIISWQKNMTLINQKDYREIREDVNELIDTIRHHYNHIKSIEINNYSIFL